MENRYLNNDGRLKDNKISANIRKAADTYENGKIIEAQDLLIEIVNAISDFEG